MRNLKSIIILCIGLYSLPAYTAFDFNSIEKNNEKKAVKLNLLDKVGTRTTNTHMTEHGYSFSNFSGVTNLQVYGGLQHQSNDGFLNDGKISLTISGGTAPYSVSWPGGGTGISSANLARGNYPIVVTDSKGVSQSTTYDLGYQTTWDFFYGLMTRNDSLVFDSTYSNSASIVSKNLLKASTSGWTEYVIGPYSSNCLFGFIDGTNPALESSLAIDYGFYIGTNNALYSYSGGTYTFIQNLAIGDVIRLGRNSTTYFISKNGVNLNTRTAPTVPLKIKVHPSGNLYLNLGASFNLPIQVDYNQNSILTTQAPTSGYIYLMPKYGVKPYTYLWSNSTTDAILTDLGIGIYTATVTDASGASLSMSFKIGYQSQWAKVTNMNVNSYGDYVLVNKDAPGSAFTNKYLSSGQDGYYEFSVVNANSNFNFALQSYNTTTGLITLPPIIVRQSIIRRASKSLPVKNSVAYNIINFADTVRSTDSVNIIQKEFVNYPCNNCSRSSVSGIQIDYGQIYAINNGVTTQKGIAIQNNDLIRIQSNAGSWLVYKNGVALSQDGFAHLATTTTPVVGNVNMFGLQDGGVQQYLHNGNPNSSSNLGSGTVLGLVDTNIPSNQTSEGGDCVCTVDAGINSIQTTSYNDVGSVLSITKEYYDYRGEVKQTQVKNFTDKKIIITQPLYDIYGRNVGQSLPAPANTECFCYAGDFILSSLVSGSYNYNDFDVPNYTGNSSLLTNGEQDQPSAVNNSTPYKLGWYYSDNNTWESYVPTATTPYSRIQYSSVDASAPLKASKPGLKLNSGSNHETYNFKMATSGELATAFGSGLGWRVNNFSNFASTNACDAIINPVPLLNTAPISLKSISVDENGVESISFIDITGNAIASCMSGKVNGSSVHVQTVTTQMWLNDESQLYSDVHVPDGCQNTLIVSTSNITSFNTAGPSILPTFNVIDLKSGQYVKNPSTGNIDWGITVNAVQINLQAGYYRVMFKNDPAFFGQINLGHADVIYNLNYYNFALNYYDYANRLKASVPPSGFDNSYIHNYTPSGSTIQKNISVVNSTLNQPAYFTQGKTWSFSETDYVNNLSLNLSAQAYNYENTQLNITFDHRGAKPIETNGSSQTIATGRHAYTLYPDSGTVIPHDSIVKETKTVHFRVKVALLNSANEVIPNTTQERTDLICTIRYTSDSNNPQYLSWSPITISYGAQFGNSVTPQSWSSIKLLALEPLSPDANGDNSVYESLIHSLVITISTAKISSNNTPLHGMVERYRYNSWSSMICSVSPDEGRTDLVYTADGNPKYIRNAKESASNSSPYYRKFSFISSDLLGRPLATGENNPTTQTSGIIYFETYEDQGNSGANYGIPPAGATSILNYYIGDDQFNPASWIGGTSDLVQLFYDDYDLQFWSQNLSPASGLTPAVYTQHHLSGRLSYSTSDKKKTWYSYDEFGRPEWVVQKYIGVNPSSGNIIKTFQYKYDYSGNVSEVIYNAESTADCLHHFYEYDQDNRLKRVYTQRPPVAPATTSDKVEQASYTYYMHGPLKRTQLGNKMQGIDYIYTINGWLKGMNSAEMDATHDPGGDGYAGTSGNLYKDLFGFDLEYFNGDYQRTNSNVQTYNSTSPASTFAPDQFNGLIKAQRWQTNEPTTFTGLTYANKQLMYGYSYDKKSQLTDAKFSPVNSNGTAGLLSDNNITPTSNEYRVFNLSYDNNGNIKNLKRNVYTAASGGILMDDLSYVYNSCGNRLLKATDAVSANPYNTLGFKSGQADNNYIYDEIGELTSDVSNNKKYEYNSTGNLIRIRDMSNNVVAEYDYDESGFRIQKTAYLSATSQKRTLYVRDASGNIIASYEKTANGNTTSYASPAEWDIYGAGRLGDLDNTSSTENYIYELADHLGNVRTTFKKQAKTLIATSFNPGVTTDDNGWFVNTNNSLSTTFMYSSNPTGNTFVRTKKTAGTEYGAGSKPIPVKYGNTVVIKWKTLWETGPIPVAGMEIKLTDGAGNPIGGTTGLQYIPMLSNGGTNNWLSYTQTVNITANYPDMYISFYPHNKDNTGATAYFDDMNLSFTTGSAFEPAMLSMADYYPHGSVMPGQSYNSTYNYRYGYQGQFAEKDDESNESFFEARNYDVLLGKWKNPDPNKQFYSPYEAMGNTPVNMIDPDGRDGIFIVFPDYKISVGGVHVPYLGHAGVLLIDNKTGVTKYYEFGRYDKAGKGLVRQMPVPNVKLGKDGLPTKESLDKVMNTISKQSGQGTKVEGAYFKSNEFAEMLKYAQSMQKQNENPARKSYNLLKNNCGTFAIDVLSKDKTLDLPNIIDPRPNSMIEEMENVADKTIEYIP